MSPQESIALGGLLQLLGRLLAEELNPELVAILQQPNVSEVLVHAEPDCAPLLDQIWTEEAFEQASVDYCALFILPKGVSPIASAWTDKGVESETLSASIQQMVDSLLSQIDLPLPAAFDGIPAEHAGLLLYLGGSLAAAADGEMRAQALPFLRATTVPWLGQFSRQLSQTKQSAIYRALGVVLGQWVDEMGRSK